MKSVIRVTSEYGSSTLIQDFAMYRDRDQIEVRVTVDWHEQHKMLKLRFPLNVSPHEGTYEIPYGHIERLPTVRRNRARAGSMSRAFRAIPAIRYGLSILNDGKYSLDVNIRDIGLTVLRSPIYAITCPLHTPTRPSYYTYMDQGVQKFHYTLLPHDGSWDEAGTVRRAAELNQRPSFCRRPFTLRARCRRAHVPVGRAREHRGQRAQAGRRRLRRGHLAGLRNGQSGHYGSHLL